MLLFVDNYATVSSNNDNNRKTTNINVQQNSNDCIWYPYGCAIGMLVVSVVSKMEMEIKG